MVANGLLQPHKKKKGCGVGILADMLRQGEGSGSVLLLFAMALGLWITICRNKVV